MSTGAIVALVIVSIIWVICYFVASGHSWGTNHRKPKAWVVIVLLISLKWFSLSHYIENTKSNQRKDANDRDLLD